MVGLARLGLLSLLVGLGTPSLARAEAHPPLPDGGRVDVGGGARWIEGDLVPAGTGRFAWQMSSTFSLGIDLGFAGVSSGFGGGGASLWMANFGFTLAWQPQLFDGVYPYAALSSGYSVVGRDDGAGYAEGSAPAFGLGVGVYVPLAGRLGLIVEDRWTFAQANLDVGAEELLPLDIGGNMLWAGVVITFDPAPPVGSGL